MSEEELIETLRAFEKNRVEQLEEPAKNLFYAIMEIADERDRLNNIINTILDFNFFKEECPLNLGYTEKCDEERETCIDDLWGEIPKLLDILKGVDKE